MGKYTRHSSLRGLASSIDIVLEAAFQGCQFRSGAKQIPQFRKKNVVIITNQRGSVWTIAELLEIWTNSV